MADQSSRTPSAFPALRYTDARAAIDWLIQAFGFRKNAEFAGPGDTILHAELCFGPSVVGLSSVAAATPDNPWSNVRQGVYVCVKDADAHYARAQHAGAEIVMPIRDMEYGAREYTARDPEGFLWGFGTYDMGRGQGAPTLFPEVHYRNPRAALTCLTDAFGFTKTLDVPTSDGGLLHAELQMDDGHVLVGTTPAEGSEWAGITQLVCAYVEDPDQHHLRARAGGATILSEPEDTPYGARQYVARDPEGFVWMFGTYRPS
jgi:uncharacterized glyoxalase superfamily protein PhnB